MQQQAVVGARRFLSSSRRVGPFPSLATALRVFYEQNDHFVVPRTFQVPLNDPSNAIDTSPWPEETRGLHLGRDIRRFVKYSNVKYSRKLQNVRRQLDAVGFPAVHDWTRFHWEQVVLSALKTFKEITGDLLVPLSFKVPEGDLQWPKATWGLTLGSRVNYLRRNRDKLTELQIQDLRDIGFVWVVADHAWDNKFMPALRRFREIYGHCEIPQAFVVGDGSDERNEAVNWNEILCGYRLGGAVNSIRAGVAYSEYVDRDRKELDELGFHLNSNDQKWQDIILPAFETYHRVHGNCNIDTFFTVPAEEPWSESMWGMRLGFIARNIRNRGDFFEQLARDLEKLEKIGFVWNVAATKWEYAVMPALETYVREYGNADIPGDFVVPSEDHWPVDSHGLKLGQMANDATRRERFSDFIEIDRLQLEALGFFWSIVPNDDISDFGEEDDVF